LYILFSFGIIFCNEEKIEELLLWTLSELLLMMFQRRMPLSQYADVFLSSFPPSSFLLAWFQKVPFYFESFASNQCNPYQHCRLGRELLKEEYVTT